jgi:hypothetical protein
VFYLPTGLAWYSVGSGISCGARKLARTPRVTKKKNKIMDLRMKRMFDIIIYIYRKCIEIVFTFKKLFLILINQNNINTINKINLKKINSYKNIFQPTKKSKREGLSTIQIPNSSF